MTSCDCGAATEGKWAGIHAPDCATLAELPSMTARKCHELAEEAIQSVNIGIDHRARCIRLGVLIQKTIVEWMAANPPQI